MSMTKDAIEQIQQAKGIQDADAVLSKLGLQVPVVALPADFRVSDLEKYLPQRTRLRGKMETGILDAFTTYATDHASPGHSACFVDAEEMSAQVIFNLGDATNPGHGDFAAELCLQRTSEYRAIRYLDGERKSQKELAEFMEDYADSITAYNADGDGIALSRAISAVRRITIEARRESSNSEESFKAERTGLESIEARSDDGLPAGFRFQCVPYPGMRLRTFDLRLSVLTGGEKPVMVARIKRLESTLEEMGEELAARLREALPCPVHIGSFSL